GHRLFDYGKDGKDIIAESWELSFFPDMESIIDSGSQKGRKLCDIATKIDLGSNIKHHKFFPVLIKFIDANKDLSVQVHPSDEYALEHENSYGKTEMWYVIDADKDAKLYIGFNKDVDKNEVKERIDDNTIMDVMNHISVKAGDCYYIPSGTLHAIGKGCLIIEIQENSNLTYRVYDYNRVDANGNKRELHIEKALKVINYSKTDIKNLTSSVLVDNEYFKVSKLNNPKSIKADSTSFVSFSILEGSGDVNGVPFNKGDTFFVPADNEAIIHGDALIISTSIN
ncbi:MAG: class I mannose-6-phosphate isomerase, partial [Bacilli bacterium]|nr:class I mannose-6-phosphate isomerase [Bacilli bacterium]